MADDPVRIAQFWQAVEIFSPQNPPKLDPKKPTVDIRRGEPMPWESGFRLREPRDGYAWQYDVYGGLYPLKRVRDTLIEAYQQDIDEEPPPKGNSALFACTIDAEGYLVGDSMVVSACAWGVGRISQRKSPLGDFAADTERYADSLKTRARIRAGVRVLGEAIRSAVPDSVAGAVSAALSGIAGPLGPLGAGLAAGVSNAAKTFTVEVIGTKDKAASASQGQGEGQETADAETAHVRLDAAAITRDDLRYFISWLADQLGVTDSLKPRDVRVQCREIKINGNEDSKADPFLNSLLAEDLALIAEALRIRNAGPALTHYLTPDGQISKRSRTNVKNNPEHVLSWCQPHLVPPGRWVTGTDRPLAFSQQFAVNRIMHEHGAGQPGVFAVNGPPGTGKTTMLRDLVAAIVVNRAEVLAGLASPHKAFTGGPCTWETPTYTHHITRLILELTGNEIVVASSNNAAVENVTSEIPGRKGIDDQWLEAAAAVDYFTATAERVTGEGAWALVAAVLGKSGNRTAFVNNVWFGKDSEGKRTGAGLLDALKSPAQPANWPSAVSDFRRALEKVKNLSAERSGVSAHLTGLLSLRGERDRATMAYREATALREAAEAGRPEAASVYDRWIARQADAEAAIRAHGLTRPGLFAGKSRRREWNTEQDRLAQEVSRVAALAATAWNVLSDLDRKISDARRAEQAARTVLATAEAAVGDAERSIAHARRNWGEHVPDGPEYAETGRPDLIEKRELSSPWADEEFSRARTELFLSALALHKAFVLAEAPRIRKNLNALKDMFMGKGRPKDPAAVLAAWQTLFLVVPVVSTTFASFGRMFAGLGRESLGWLLVDEAGQAAPQNAAGALWRSKRAVIVGDPLQIEPVVTLPWGGQRALLGQFKVGTEWAPSRSSVQQLADRLAVDGTWLPGPGADDVWVGAPLRVHRRCDRPMFTVSNTIAYHGLMVFGTPTGREPFHGQNAWLDVRSSAGGSNWIQAEGEVLREVLTGLRDNGGVPAKEIRVISPYRNAAEEAKKIHKELFPGVSGDDRDTWVGTVHKMQGREADAVILVLGGDPARPGSRRFATETPNLLNVAVTRARRRLYVIGNYETWGNEHYFTEVTGPDIPRRYRTRDNAAG